MGHIGKEKLPYETPAVIYSDVLKTRAGSPLSVDDGSNDDEPGALYREGLQAIANQRGISIKEAAEQTVVELTAGHAEEHIQPTLNALEQLQSRRNR